MLFATPLPNAQSDTGISTKDIANFWSVFDQVLQEPDSLKSIAIIQSKYVDQASLGLTYFIQSRKFEASDWYQMIHKYPKYLSSIRRNTLTVEVQKVQIANVLSRFKQLYPAFKKPAIYFCIGTLSTGGTTKNGQILIGTEILIGNSHSGISELPAFFQNLMYDVPNKMIHYIAHEAGHTQQKMHGYGLKTPLLGLEILEGSCDFIAEMLLNTSIDYLPYVKYGKERKKEFWVKFSQELYSTSSKMRDEWFYNSLDYPVGQGDLGYYLGYEICKSYYGNSKDKKKAVREILNINYDDPK